MHTDLASLESHEAREPRATAPFCIDERFWEALSHEGWGSEPSVFPSVLSQPILSEREALATLMRVFATPHLGASARFYVDGGLVEDFSKVRAMWPTAEDVSIAGYIQRISISLGGRRFGLVVNDAQRYDRPLWKRIRSFVGRVHSASKRVATKVDAVLFIGNYDATPFGVHRDPESVFTFALTGEKRMLVWSDGYLQARGRQTAGNVSSEEASEIASEATVLVITPADIMYWPDSSWHVAQGKGSAVATLTVGLNLDHPAEKRSPLTPLLAALNAAVVNTPELRALRVETPSAQGGFTVLPEAWQQIATRVAEIVNPAAIRAEITRDWLRRVSSNGVLPPPAAEKRLLREASVVRLDSECSLFSVDSDAGVLLGANGYTIESNIADGARALVAALVSGTAMTVREGAELFVGVDPAPGGPMEARKLLQFLANVDALVVT